LQQKNEDEAKRKKERKKKKGVSCTSRSFVGANIKKKKALVEKRNQTKFKMMPIDDQLLMGRRLVPVGFP
jgi:ribosome assembly protein YihI (activator of Der GTPase)